MHLQSLFAAVVCFGLAASAYGASNVSSKYDGVYSGAAEPVTGMGAPNCPAFVIADVTIASGFLRTPQTTGQPTLSGFITEDGYLSAYLARPGRPRFPMDGRLENQTITAGFIDTEDNCYWIVRLAPSR